VSVEEAYATEEQYDLLHSYLISRHHGGGMSEMDFIRYEMMVEECASETEIIEYRNKKNTLVAAVLIDRLQDGLSMVYSFFDPDLGNLMILDQIKRCQELGLDYLYLGYWVDGSPKMDYKARYQPCEILGPDGWRLMETKI